MPIRVLIVVDRRVIRQGMKMSLALDSEFGSVEEAGNREQALVMVEISLLILS
jgi:YesN/AraC family two-component response regulator